LPFCYLLRLQQLAARDARTILRAFRHNPRTTALVDDAARTLAVRRWLLCENAP
jgi:hypothetical protein